MNFLKHTPRAPRSDPPMPAMPIGPDGLSHDDSVLVTRTYLTLAALDRLHPSIRSAAAPTCHLVPLSPCPVETWRRLYADVGKAWQWHDRDAWDQTRLEDHLRRAETHIYHVVDERPDTAPQVAGMLELEQHADGSVEIVYLGLLPSWFGQGLGGWLVEAAVRTAFALGASRVWLHTCTLDAPSALPNYLARGFTVDRTETYRVPRTFPDSTAAVD